MLGLDPSVRAPSAMVASIDVLASQTGVALLRAGGSAADAAVGASAVLAVTAPHMCGIGGDLFALVHTGQGPPQCCDASGRAGSGADPDRLRAQGHRRMPFRDDVRAATIPGCVDGWVTLHERYGRLPFANVLAPAIGYARDGFPASSFLAAATALLHGVEGVGALAPPVEPGRRIVRADLADTLVAVADGGREAFYRGAFGEALVDVGRGEYTAADLAQVQAEWVAALGARVWGHDVWTVPPTSQGYLTLLGALIAEELPLGDDPDAAVWAHLLVESARVAGTDRADVLHEGADVSRLLEADEVARRRALVSLDRRRALPHETRAGGTMFLCAVDEDRMGVSLIQSNASGFGCHIAVPGTGVLLHNRGIGFSLEPGHRAEYGPGRRPPHTLSPALVTSPDGRLSHVLGTMGGDSQPQVLGQLLARMLRDGASPGEAIGAPRWVLRGGEDRGFDTWEGPAAQQVVLERRAERAWAQGLRDRGHLVVVESSGPRFGHAQAIAVVGDHLAGAADPRAVTGAAIGW